MEATVSKREITVQRVHYVIWIALQFVIWNLLPPTGSLSASGVHTLAIFAGFIYGILFIKQFAVPCLAVPILMGYSGVFESMSASFIAAFGNDTFVMIFCIFLFSGVIIYSGLTKELALRLINSKVTKGRPWVLTLFIQLTAAILGAIIHPLVVIAIVTELCIEIFRELGMKCNRWTIMILADISIISHISQLAMPFQFCNVITFGVLSSMDPKLQFANFSGIHMLNMTFLTVGMIALCWLATRILCANCVEEMSNYIPRDKFEPLTEKMKIALGLLIFYCGIQLFPVFLPNGALKNMISYPGLCGFSTFVAIVAMALHTKDRENFISFDSVREFGLNWFTLLMLVALGSITYTFTADSPTGIIAWFGEILMPICGNVSPFMAFAIIAAFSIICTNLLDDMAVVFFTVPVAYVVSTALGMNPVWFVSWTAPCMLLGGWLPSSSPLMAMIFALEPSGYVTRSALIRWNPLRILFAYLICITVGWICQGLYPVF